MDEQIQPIYINAKSFLNSGELCPCFKAKKKKKEIRKFFSGNIFFCLRNFFENLQKSSKNDSPGHMEQIYDICKKSLSPGAFFWCHLKCGALLHPFTCQLMFRKERKKEFWAFLFFECRCTRIGEMSKSQKLRHFGQF